MLVLFVLAQASAAASGEAERVVIDLLVPPPCSGDDLQRLQGEIVVCASRDGDGRHRVTDPKAATAEALPRAELRLADGTVVSAETESADMGMARSQRLMVRLKFKF